MFSFSFKVVSNFLFDFLLYGLFRSMLLSFLIFEEFSVYLFAIDF